MNYPLEDGKTEKKEVSPGDFTAKWTPEFWSDKEEVLKAINNPDYTIVDVRDPEEWSGESSSPYGRDFVPRKGRIPGAKHLFWKELMEVKNGVTYLKSPEEIRKIAKDKGIEPEKKVIVYCFKGARASNTLVGLREAGFERVSNYFASWNEWSKDFELPVDDRLL